MGLSQAQKDQILQVWVRQNFSGGTLRAGLIPGAIGRFRRGRNLDVDQGTLPETIWPAGGLYPFQTVSYQATVNSSSGSDTLAGTGAQRLRILGMDANFVRVEEEIDLNGITPVLTTRTDWIRILEVFVIQVGTDPSGTNIGTIDISVNGGTAALQGRIFPGFGVTTQAVHTIPEGNTGFLVGRGAELLGTQTGATAVEVSVFVRLPGEAWLVLEQFSLRASGTSSIFDSRAQFPIVAPPRTDIDIRITGADANNSEVLASLDIIEIENQLLQTLVSTP